MTAIYAILAHAAQASFMSAVIWQRHARARQFLLFLSFLRLKFGSCVQKIGHDGNAEKRHGKLLPWKVKFFKGITAMAEGIDGNCRRVISGLAILPSLGGGVLSFQIIRSDGHQNPLLS